MASRSDRQPTNPLRGRFLLISRSTRPARSMGVPVVGVVTPPMLFQNMMGRLVMSDKAPFCAGFSTSQPFGEGRLQPTFATCSDDGIARRLGQGALPPCRSGMLPAVVSSRKIKGVPAPAARSEALAAWASSVRLVRHGSVFDSSINGCLITHDYAGFSATRVAREVTPYRGNQPPQHAVAPVIDDIRLSVLGQRKGPLRVPPGSLIPTPETEKMFQNEDPAPQVEHPAALAMEHAPNVAPAAMVEHPAADALGPTPPAATPTPVLKPGKKRTGAASAWCPLAAALASDSRASTPRPQRQRAHCSAPPASPSPPIQSPRPQHRPSALRHEIRVSHACRNR